MNSFRTAENYQLSDILNSSTVFNKREFSKLVVKTIQNAEESQWKSALSADPSLSIFEKNPYNTTSKQTLASGEGRAIETVPS
jgi:hypothetical protein